ncbi:hypothetical protein PV325_002481 [Microctonus aethiopoides]|nr:hypothetical protein PV325_002481 [Microctonus aethiopoides]
MTQLKSRDGMITRRECTFGKNVSDKSFSVLPGISLSYFGFDLGYDLHMHIQGGEYMHIGLELVLTAFMDECNAKLTVNHSTLSLNVDGLPSSRPSTQPMFMANSYIR